MINFKKAFFTFGTKFFTTLGKKIATGHKRTIQKLKKDHSGTRFEPYTDDYRIRKMAGKAAPNQISRSGEPDLTLTGKMMSSFKFIKADKAGFEYGIEDSAMAERMEFQGPRKKTRKRFTSTETNPTPPVAQKLIVKEMQKQIVRNFTKELRKNGMGYKVYTI